MGALVRQATGEDWTNVRLMLSTARPKLGSEAPQPAPLVIDGYEQKRDKVLVQAQERREQLDAGGGGAARSGPQAAALDDKGNAFVLTLPHPVTVVADGRPVWAPVDVVETQAAVKLVATPKLDEHVYQIAALKNPAAYPLLEGRVRSYRHGSYVGDSRLRHQGVGAPFEISLGIDEELKAERKTLDDKDKSAGFLSSTKHIFRGYRTKLTNRAAGPGDDRAAREHPRLQDRRRQGGAAGQADDRRLPAGRRARLHHLDGHARERRVAQHRPRLRHPPARQLAGPGTLARATP